MKKLIIFLLITVNLGLFAGFSYSAWNMLTDIAAYDKMKSNSITVEADVAGHSVTTIKGRKEKYKYDYAFTDQSGTQQYVTDERDTKTKREDGTKVTVYYNLSDPADFYVDGGKYGYDHAPYAVGTLAGLLIAISLTGVYIRHNRRSD